MSIIMETETIHAAALFAAAAAGFAGGTIAFVIALYWTRRRDDARHAAEQLATADAVLNEAFDSIMHRRPTAAERSYYVPRLLNHELTRYQLGRLLDVEAMAVDQ